MSIGPDTSLETLAGIVSETLERAGVAAVLCGGAVVSIYSHNEYQSHDLDFVTSDGLRRLGTVMAELGFEPGKGRYFVHPHTEFSVEFPAGPVMIGDQLVTEVAHHRTQGGTVRLLTPTDAVKDRLAAFLHWNDRQGVEQALQIIRRQAIDMGKVEQWALAEAGDAPRRFGLVRDALWSAVSATQSQSGRG